MVAELPTEQTELGTCNRILDCKWPTGAQILNLLAVYLPIRDAVVKFGNMVQVEVMFPSIMPRASNTHPSAMPFSRVSVDGPKGGTQ